MLPLNNLETYVQFYEKEEKQGIEQDLSLNNGNLWCEAHKKGQTWVWNEFSPHVLKEISTGKLKLDEWAKILSDYNFDAGRRFVRWSDKALVFMIIGSAFAIQSKLDYYNNTTFGRLTRLFFRVFGLWNNGLTSSIRTVVANVLSFQNDLRVKCTPEEYYTKLGNLKKIVFPDIGTPSDVKYQRIRENPDPNDSLLFRVVRSQSSARK